MASRIDVPYLAGFLVPHRTILLDVRQCPPLILIIGNRNGLACIMQAHAGSSDRFASHVLGIKAGLPQPPWSTTPRQIFDSWAERCLAGLAMTV